MFQDILNFIKNLYPEMDFIPLHAPVFGGNEKKYVADCIDSTFVSSVSDYSGKFEALITQYTGAKYAIATVNGTSALHAALVVADVNQNCEVLTQALTFVATANAISYTGAQPIFIDSDPDHLGMSETILEEYLSQKAELRNDGFCYNLKTNKKIKACVPMHVFGHPLKIEKILAICKKYNIMVIEDAAESLGSFYKGGHTGIFGDLGILSFNGNKIITCGGGGMILTNNEALAKRAKHITTTAKIPHAFEFHHDQIGFNYRMPGLNAALACAQMESLVSFVENKRETANLYSEFFNKKGIKFITEPDQTKSNYWLNAISFDNSRDRDLFLQTTNANGVMTRPVWQLMTDLPPFQSYERTNMDNAKKIAKSLVNIPSGVRV